MYKAIEKSIDGLQKRLCDVGQELLANDVLFQWFVRVRRRRQVHPPSQLECSSREMPLESLYLGEIEGGGRFIWVALPVLQEVEYIGICAGRLVSDLTT